MLPFSALEISLPIENDFVCFVPGICRRKLGPHPRILLSFCSNGIHQHHQKEMFKENSFVIGITG
jgi:hypothetical protein